MQPPSRREGEHMRIVLPLALFFLAATPALSSVSMPMLNGGFCYGPSHVMLGGNRVAGLVKDRGYGWVSMYVGAEEFTIARATDWPADARSPRRVLRKD